MFIPSKNLYGKILNVLIATKADSISGSPTENKPVYEFGYKVAGLDKEYYYLAPSEIKLIEDKEDEKYKTITETKVFKQFNLSELDNLLNEILFSSKDDYVERDENENSEKDNNTNSNTTDCKNACECTSVIYTAVCYYGEKICSLLEKINRKI